MHERPYNPRIARCLRGFSLLELLTVVAIIALLLAVGIPSVILTQGRHGGGRSMVLLQSLDGGCRLYSSEYRGHFPPSNDPAWGLEGRCLVCQLLTGYAPASEPKDKVDGWGYKLPSGKYVPPFVNTNKTPIAKGPGNSGVFRDAFENDIYYYCQTDDWYNAKTNKSDAPGTAPFDKSHNTGGPTDINEYVKKSTAMPVVYLTTDFVLCTKGADGIWGSKSYKSNMAYENYTDIPETDDITNFLPE